MSAANVCVFVAEDRFQNRRDPMSHRIIEKRRRDRMNNCLADLSRLIPAIYLKKGRGRIEKTEIIEMAIKHLKHLQAHACKDPATCEVAQRIENDHRHQYRLGFHECMSECVRFMVEIEGMYASDDLCIRLMNHLQKHFDKVQGHGFCYQMLPGGGATAAAGGASSTGAASGGVAAAAASSAENASGPVATGGAGSIANAPSNASTQVTLAQQQQQQQQQQQALQQHTPIPIQIRPPQSTVLNSVSSLLLTEGTSSALLAAANEDVKPMDLEPSESAFTRRAGGSFAPRGGLLQGATPALLGPSSSPSDSASPQLHHLMVPKQEGSNSSSSSNGRPASAERKPSPGVSEKSRNPLLTEGVTGQQTTQAGSQLREMLQTPIAGNPSASLAATASSAAAAAAASLTLSLCEPNMRKRSNTDTHIHSSTMSSTDHHSNGSFSSATDASPAKTCTPNPNEEVYNFKKNIKERFQSNLRLFSASPTESVDGDDSKGFTGHEERRYSHSQVQGPVASPRSPASFSRHTVSAPPMGELIDDNVVNVVDSANSTMAKDLSMAGSEKTTHRQSARECRDARESRDYGTSQDAAAVVKWESSMAIIGGGGGQVNQLADLSCSAGSPPGSSSSNSSNSNNNNNHNNNNNNNNPLLSCSTTSGSSSGYSSSNGSSGEPGPRGHASTSPPPPPAPLLLTTTAATTATATLAGAVSGGGALGTGIGSGPSLAGSAGVPIFALHPKGAFYIPLTMEPSLLSPFLQSVDEAGEPLLHPVSISVNFNLASLYRQKSVAPSIQTPPWLCVRADDEPRLPLILPNGRL